MSRSRLVRTAAFSLLTGIALLGLCPSLPAQTDPPAQDPVLKRIAARRPSVPRLVFALYYPWYGLAGAGRPARHVGEIDATSKRISNFAHYPASGAYDCLDEPTLARQMRELKQAGVDVVACSWWGVKDFTHQSVLKLLPIARREGMQVCIYLENWEQAGDYPASANEMSAWLKTIGQDPSYLKVEGRPVVFIYERALRQLTPEAWADTLNNLEETRRPGLLAIAESTQLLDALLFDGLHQNNPAPLIKDGPSEARGSQLWAAAHAVVRLARARQRVAVATVSPGFDDRKNGRNGAFVDRANGEFYRQAWDAAIGTKADWVLIRSFNQWHDGTEIEPSAEFGDQYLKLTAEYARRFKQGAGGK